MPRKPEVGVYNPVDPTLTTGATFQIHMLKLMFRLLLYLKKNNFMEQI